MGIKGGCFILFFTSHFVFILVMAKQPTLFDILGRGSKKRKLDDNNSESSSPASSQATPALPIGGPSKPTTSADSPKIRIRTYRSV
jgi:hypothetical protein